MRTRSRSRGSMTPRRGVTLVIVALSLVVFIGFAALAVDLARLTNFKSELKGIADAAATSAALDLAAGRALANATTNLTTLVARNPLAGSGTATVQEISGVTWDFTNSQVTATPTWASANGVRIVTRYDMAWVLSQVFGQGTGRTLVDTSIAAIGQRLTHECLRPFALPYSAIRSRLALSPVNDTTSLTAADVFALRALTTPVTYTVLDTVNAANVTSFGWVNTREGTTATAANVAAALGGCVSGTLGAGSTLPAAPRVGDTTSVQSAGSTLCGSASTCAASPRMLVPIYTSGTNTGTGGTTTTTATNQTYDFTLTDVSNGCWSKITGNVNPFNESACGNDLARLPAVPATFTSGNTTYSCSGSPTYRSPRGANRTLIFRYSSCTVTTTTGGTGRVSSTYVIKYIASFVWTERTNTTITGYFTTVNLPPGGSGSWSGTPGPVTSVVLVR